MTNSDTAHLRLRRYKTPKPIAAAIARNGIIACKYRSSLCLTIDSATSGTTMKLHLACRRANHSSGKSVGAHQRTMFRKYQMGDWYFTREAKSGATSVRCANLDRKS